MHEPRRNWGMPFVWLPEHARIAKFWAQNKDFMYNKNCPVFKAVLITVIIFLDQQTSRFWGFWGFWGVQKQQDGTLYMPPGKAPAAIYLSLPRLLGCLARSCKVLHAAHCTLPKHSLHHTTPHYTAWPALLVTYPSPSLSCLSTHHSS